MTIDPDNIRVIRDLSECLHRSLGLQILTCDLGWLFMMSQRLQKKGPGLDFSFVILGFLLAATVFAGALLLRELVGLYGTVA
jgi:hypothetical protein